MTFGSASRSNRRRTPATRCTRPSIEGRCARRRSACSRGTSHTSITPGAPSMSAMRRYTPRVEIDRLDAGDRAGREEREQLAPRERRPVRNAQLEPAVDHEPVGHAALGAQLGRRELEHLVHHPVHLADAVEAGRGRDLRHRQVGVVEQAAREVRAPRPRDLARRRADVLREQSPQVARAHAEARREIVFGRVVERAVGDAVHGAAHELGRGDPARARARDRDGSAGTAGSRRPRPRPGARTGSMLRRSGVAGQPPPGSRCRS